MGVGVGVAVGVAVAVAVAVGVGVEVAVAVAVAVGVGVGVPPPPDPGAWIPTVIGDPVLKKPTVALALCGGWSASNRKLYIVPKRMAFALGFWAKVSQFQFIALGVWFGIHGSLLNPVLPTVPSFGKPGWFGGK